MTGLVTPATGSTAPASDAEMLASWRSKIAEIWVQMYEKRDSMHHHLLEVIC